MTIDQVEPHFGGILLAILLLGLLITGILWEEGVDITRPFH